MSHNQIIWEKALDYIDKNSTKFVSDLLELCRQPSISATGFGVQKCVDLVKKMMEDVGISTRIIPIKNGRLLIYGEIKPEKSKGTLIFYNHYDVQPPEPLEKWRHPPFSAEIQDGKVFARGVADNKGNLVARLKAVETLVKTCESLPVTVKFLVEGEEEIGSPNLPLFIKEKKEQLNADGCLWEGARKDFHERPVISLGSKGILHIELRVKGAEKDLHSRWAPVISNPTWRLILALGTMIDKNERILIEGFYDNILKPSLEENNMLSLLSEDEKKLKEILGVKSFLRGVTGEQLIKNLLFEPACTICSINSGFPEGKTALPSEASTKIHFRLVMGQRPSDIFEKVKKHLTKHGFSDITVTKIGEMEPTKTSINEDVTKTAIRAAKQVYGVNAVVHPTAPGASPMYYFNNWLKVPTISACGVGYAGSNVHAPNENIRIQDYLNGIRFLANFLLSFAKKSS
jgi:acetylornithine deacetylase/succinyl-diaminopimelate desuccinylase-like protein